jgi:hypothetical protein
LQVSEVKYSRRKYRRFNNGPTAVYAPTFFEPKLFSKYCFGSQLSTIVFPTLTQKTNMFRSKSLVLKISFYDHSRMQSIAEVSEIFAQ